MKYRMNNPKLFLISFGQIRLNLTVSLESTQITWETLQRLAISLNLGLIVWRASLPRTISTWSFEHTNAWWMDSRGSLEEHWLLSFLPLTTAGSTRMLELFWFWRQTTRSFLRWSTHPIAMRITGLRMRSSWEGGLQLRQDGGKDIDWHRFILFYHIQ